MYISLLLNCYKVIKTFYTYCFQFYLFIKLDLFDNVVIINTNIFCNTIIFRNTNFASITKENCNKKLIIIN